MRRIAVTFAAVMVLGTLAVPAIGAELVTDEKTRLQVLRLMFPDARISESPIRSWDASYTAKWAQELPLIDALRDEKLYDVLGPIAKDEEDAATDVAELITSNERTVRLRLYRWQTENSRPFLVGTLNYAFRNVQPAQCCRAIGKLLLLSDDGKAILDSISRMPQDFTMFTSIRFANLNGDRSEALMVSADFSGPMTVGINTLILGVHHEKFRPLFWTTTAVKSDLEQKMFTMALDEKRTFLARGQRYCFVKTTYIEKGKTLRPPLTSRVSYPVGNGNVAVDWLWW